MYGLSEEKSYCWVLKSLEFGGLQVLGSTLFLKVKANGSEETDGSTNIGECLGKSRNDREGFGTSACSKHGCSYWDASFTIVLQCS